MITLDQLQENRLAEVKAVEANALTAKLTDMGLYPGQRLKLAFRAPFGNPIAIEMGAYTLGLRLEEALLVKVVYVNEKAEKASVLDIKVDPSSNLNSNFDAVEKAG